MQIFFIIAFVLAIGVAVFAIQNSDADMVVMRFLIWEYKTSLVYTLLGGIGSGNSSDDPLLDPEGHQSIAAHETAETTNQSINCHSGPFPTPCPGGKQSLEWGGASHGSIPSHGPRG